MSTCFFPSKGRNAKELGSSVPTGYFFRYGGISLKHFLLGMIIVTKMALAAGDKQTESIPRRFLIPTHAALDKLSVKLGSEAKVDYLVKEDLRGDAFRLQGLARLYREYPESPKLFEAWWSTSKAIEDLMGDYGFKTDRVAFAAKVKAPEELVAHFQKKADKEKQKVIDQVDDDLGLVDLQTKLSKVRWLTYEKDREFAVARIAEEARKIQKDLSKGEYDLSELEKGIHELRRDVRWISIYAAGLNGLVITSDDGCPIQEYVPLLKSEYATGKFSKLGGPEEKIQPCPIPRCSYLALSRIVDLLGVIKDVGQAEEYLTKGFKSALGLKTKQAQERTLALLPKHPLYTRMRQHFPKQKNYEAMAETLVEEMLRTRLLLALADSFDACLKKK